MKAIAVSLLVVSFLFHPGVGHAAWQPDGNGVAVVTKDQALPQIIPDGTGGTIIVWFDSRSGNYDHYDIYAQRLNGLGGAQWAPNGVLLASAQASLAYKFPMQIVADGSGGAIVMWEDNRYDSGDIFAQRVNGSGVVQWTANGVAVCTAASVQGFDEVPSLISDGVGGAIVAWQDSRNAYPINGIYAQRVNGSGVMQWTANGVAVSVGPDYQEHSTVASDGAGGTIITWDQAPLFASRDIYAQRVNASGAPLWTANGVPVCAEAGDQYKPEAVPDGVGGVIVAWEDVRNSIGNKDIYSQRLDKLGFTQWNSSGVAVCTAPGYQSRPELVASAGGAIVAWTDQRSGDDDIYAQRLNASGVAQWLSNGVALCTVPGNQSFPLGYGGATVHYPVIASNGAGGAYVTWEDTRNAGTDIYAQQVTFSGLAVFPNGAALCTAAGVQNYPAITYTGPFGDAVVTWEDERNEGIDIHDVYASPVPNTPVGPFVRYVPYPHGDLIAQVHLVFHDVVTEGFTYLNITPAGPSLPPSFVLGDGRYYNLSTTAQTTDNIEVCIKFDPAALQHPAAALRMFEYNVAGPAGPTWLDVTTQPAMGDSICGTTTTLSTFVIGWPSVTGVGDTPVPASFALHPNLPNPFNPITTIHYDVPAPGADVNISVYDVSGRLIRSLVKEHRGAGTWSVQWNGQNDRGQSVASGVYFYRMRAGEFVETRKMMLLK